LRRNVTAQHETRPVVEGYFAAWTSNKIDEACPDDVKIAGPTVSYDGAAAFRPALVKFAAITRGARAVELIVDGERAALLSVKIGSFLVKVVRSAPTKSCSTQRNCASYNPNGRRPEPQRRDEDHDYP
jgi:hypothetical protein